LPTRQRQALLAGGPHADIAFSLANTLQAQGTLEQAAERFPQAVEIAPIFTEAWNNLGACFEGLEKPESACDCYRRALRIDPDDPRALWNLADTLDKMKKYAEAAPLWKRYLSYDNASEHRRLARRGQHHAG
jgi:tetratricopeptide (TPR) repeat protein